LFCISGLSKQSKLTWLSLAGNSLTTLDTGVLEKLPLLRYLSVENNAIAYLRGLQVSCLFFCMSVGCKATVTVTCAPTWTSQNKTFNGQNSSFKNVLYILAQHISLSVSAELQREVAKVKVLRKTWTHGGEFPFLCLNLNPPLRIQFPNSWATKD